MISFADWVVIDTDVSSAVENFGSEDWEGEVSRGVKQKTIFAKNNLTPSLRSTDSMSNMGMVLFEELWMTVIIEGRNAKSG